MAEFTSESDRLAWGRCMNGQPNVKDAFIGGMEWGRNNPQNPGPEARQDPESKDEEVVECPHCGFFDSGMVHMCSRKPEEKKKSTRFKPGDVVSFAKKGEFIRTGTIKRICELGTCSIMEPSGSMYSAEIADVFWPIKNEDKIQGFKPGDVVQLKSGGVSMVVISTIGIKGSRRPDPLVHVSWVDSSGKPWEQDLSAAAFKMADCSEPTDNRKKESPPWLIDANSMKGKSIGKVAKMCVDCGADGFVFNDRIVRRLTSIDTPDDFEERYWLIDAKTPTAAT